MDTTLVPKMFSFPISLIVSLLFTLSIIDLANRKKIFDGNNSLKHHLERVCSLGGISIFSSFWIAISIVSEVHGIVAFNYLFVGAFIVFLTGVKDDLVGISAIARLAIQVGVASLMFAGGVRLTYLPGLEVEVPVFASYFLTVFLIGAVVNAYNFIDGINGLAGGLAIISALAFAMLFYFSGMGEYAVLALALAGAVFGFLWFNFGRAKIFMGDNGSTFIGLLLSFFTVVFFQNHARVGGGIACPPLVVFSFLAVPLVDLAKVVLGRVSRGCSPFKGDRTHIHHLMLNAGFGQRSICWALYTWSAVVIAVSFVLLPQNIVIGGLALLLAGSLPYLLLNIFSKTKKEKQHLRVTATKAGEAL